MHIIFSPPSTSNQQTTVPENGALPPELLEAIQGLSAHIVPAQAVGPLQGTSQPAMPLTLCAYDKEELLPDNVKQAIHLAKESSTDPDFPAYTLLDGPISPSWQNDLKKKIEEDPDCLNNHSDFTLFNGSLLNFSEEEIKYLLKCIESQKVFDDRSNRYITPNNVVQEHAVVFSDTTLILSELTLLRFAYASSRENFVEFPITNLESLSSKEFFALLKSSKSAPLDDRKKIEEQVEGLALSHMFSYYDLNDMVLTQKKEADVEIKQKFDLIIETLNSYELGILDHQIDNLNLPQTIARNVFGIGHYLIEEFCKCLLNVSERNKLEFLIAYDAALTEKSPELQVMFKNKATEKLKLLSDPIDWKVYVIDVQGNLLVYGFIADEKRDIYDQTKIGEEKYQFYSKNRLFILEHFELIKSVLSENCINNFLLNQPVQESKPVSDKKKMLMDKLGEDSRKQFELGLQLLDSFKYQEMLDIKFNLKQKEEEKAHTFLRELFLHHCLEISTKLALIGNESPSPIVKIALIGAELKKISPFLMLYYFETVLSLSPLADLQQLYSAMKEKYTLEFAILASCRDVLETPTAFLNQYNDEKLKLNFLTWLEKHLKSNPNDTSTIEFCVWRLPAAEKELKTEILASTAEVYFKNDNFDLAEEFAKKLALGERKEKLLLKIAKEKIEGKQGVNFLPEKRKLPNVPQGNSKAARLSESNRERITARGLSAAEDAALDQIVDGTELYEILFQDLAFIEVSLPNDENLKKVETFFNWAQQMQMPSCYKVGIAIFYCIEHMKKSEQIEDINEKIQFSEGHGSFLQTCRELGVDYDEIMKHYIHNSGHAQPGYRHAFTLQWVNHHVPLRNERLKKERLQFKEVEFVNALVSENTNAARQFYKENPYVASSPILALLYERTWQDYLYQSTPWSLFGSLQLIENIIDNVLPSDLAKLSAINFAITQTEQYSILKKLGHLTNPFRAYNELMERKKAALLNR